METSKEWAVVGMELLRRDSEATLWDLMKVMYEYKTGCDFPEIPDELTVVRAHMQGLAAKSIAFDQETYPEVIIDILTSCGFKPFRKSLGESVFNIMDTASHDYTEEELAECLGISKYMVSRAFDEYETWCEYVGYTLVEDE